MPRLRLFYLIVFLTPISLFANKEFPISYNSATPYMLVISDDSKSSDLDPGLYHFEDSINNPKLSLKGEILLDPNEGALVGRLEAIHEKNRRYESIIVLDGKLTIITKHTDSKFPDSFLQIGEGESLILDQLNKNYTPLPKITSFSDIVVMPTEKTGGYLISVKGYMGDGFTFYFELGLSESGDRRLFFEKEPVLLDNKFYNNLELTNRQKRGSFISDRLIKFLSFPDPSDSLVIKDFKRQLQKDYSALERNWKDSVMVPVISLQDFSIENTSNLRVDLGSSLVQEIDPIKNTSVIKKKGARGNSPALKKAWVDTVGDYEQPFYKKVIGYDNATLVFIEGVLHLSIDDFFLEISEVYSKLPEELSALYVETISDKLYLILSQLNDGIGKTSVLEFSLPASGSGGKMQLLSSRLISENYYYDRELEYRQHLPGVFDYFTPSQKNIDAVVWGQDLDLTRPMFDFYRSVKSGEIVKKYIKPVEEQSLGNSLSYRVFNEENNQNEARVTGVYLEDKLIYAGDLVELEIGNETSSFFRRTVSIYDQKTQNFENQEATIIFVDNSYRGGQKLAGILVVIPKVNVRYSVVGELEEPKEETFHSMSLILPLEKDVRGGHLLLASEPGPERESWVYNYKVSTVKDGTSPSAQFYLVKNLLEKDIENRVRLEKKGDYYLVEDTQVSSRNLRLYSLKSSDESVYPNRSQFKSLSFEGISTTVETNAWENPWLITNPNHDESFAFLKKSSAEKYKSQLFDKLMKEIERIADGSTKEKHHIFVVPESLQDYIYNLILSYWKDGKGYFGQANKKLLFNVVRNSPIENQTVLMEVFNTLAKEQMKGKTPLIFAQWAEVYKMERPKAEKGENVFELNYVSNELTDDREMEEFEESYSEKDKEGSNIVYSRPHAAYLMATEGKKLGLQEFSQAKDQAKVPMIILANESELKEFAEHNFEADYGFLDHFEIHQLPKPSLDQQSKLFEKLFEEKLDLKMLRYKFDAKNISSSDPILQKDWDELNFEEKEHVKKLIFNYYVQRINAVAEPNGIPPLMALTNIVNEFYRQLISNADLRASRTITTVLIERILSEKYGTPLNLETLPENDPLKIVSSHRFLDYIFRSNHDADIAVVEQVRKTRLGQTKKDPALKVPSSMILVGPTGTGKTSLWLAIQKAIGNKLYRFDSDNNEEARAFFINLEKVVPEVNLPTQSRSKGSNLNTTEVLKHLDNFLTGPYGARGDILLDDVSKAHPKVLGKILAKLYEILDAEDGVYYAKGENEIREIPVGNLNITLTLNPTEKESKLAEFGKDSKKLTLNELIVATLNSDEFSFDKSHLARFSKIIALDQYSENAKIPGLIRDMKASINSDFISQNRLSLFTNDFVESIAEYFSDMDARRFKSSTVQTAMDMTQNTTGTLKVFAPSKEQKMELLYSRAKMGSQSLNVDDFLEDYTQVLKVGESQEANFRVLQIMLDSFRVQLYDSLFKNISLQFSSVKNSFQREIGEQLLLALGEHLANKPQIPLRSLRLDPSSYNLKHADDIESFYKLLEAIDGHKNSSTNFYPSENLFKLVNKDELGRLSGANQSYPSRTEADTFIESSKRLEHPLTSLLEKMIYLNPTGELPVEEWLQSIDEESERAQITEALSEELRTISSLFFEELNRMVKELAKLDKEERKSYSIYDQTRLFLFSLDRAIASLNWDRYLSFKLNVLNQFSSNMVIGSRASVQNYLFKNRFSLLWPRAHSSLLDLIENSDLLKPLNVDFETQDSERERKLYQKCRSSAVVAKPAGGDL